MKPTIKLLAHRPVVFSDRPCTLQLLVKVMPPIVKRTDRPPMNVALAIDRSGSMTGPPLMQARAAAKMLVDQMGPEDQLSVISFDDVARVVVPRVAVIDKEKIKARIDTIVEGGGTNLHQGWLEACNQLGRVGRKSVISRVIVLSDGQTNVGLVCLDSICGQVVDWERRGVGTSTIGLGIHYNEVLLSKMSGAGGGNFFHASSPEQLEPFFQTELYGLSLTYGSQAGLRLETLSGAQALRLYNPMENRQDGTLRLTDLVYGVPKDVVFELSVPEMPTPRDLVRVVLNYTDRESGLRCQVTETLRLPCIEHARLDEFPVQPEVLQKRALQLAARGLKAAQQSLATQRYDEAQEILQEVLAELAEAEPSPQLREQMQEIEGMLKGLERREYQSVQKAASYQSVSISSSSVTLAGFPIQEWMALPEHERTQERLKQMMEDGGFF
ncbi:MAG: VWA domain-containing protein [Vulcanimicrobiota bacterium]